MEELDIQTITRRSVSSVLVLISRAFVLNIISFGAFLIIATKLSATELGLYTAVIAIQRIINFFTDFGLGAALVQKKESLEKEDIITSFTTQSVLAFIIFLIVFLFQSFFRTFFHLPESALNLLLVLVFTIFLSSFKTIPSILLERSLQFQKLVIPQIAESLTFNIILVVFLLNGFQLQSFTLAFLISSIIGIPFYYFVSPWPIRFGINRKSLSHLKYGTQFQAKNILATIKDDLLVVILSKFLSFTEIGYIGFAQRLAFFVFRYVVDSVTKVTFSTYARLNESKQYLKSAIEKSLFFVSSTMFPILFGLIVISPYIVSYFPKWHNKWEPAVISLIFFCLNAAISSLSGILVNVLDATGRVKTTLKLMIVWTLLTWILTPLLIALYGYNGVSVASFLVTLTIFFTSYLVKRIVSFHFLKSTYKPMTATGIMVVVVYFLAKVVAHDFPTLIFVILLGGGVYLLTLLSFAHKEIRSDIKTILSKT